LTLLFIFAEISRSVKIVTAKKKDFLVGNNLVRARYAHVSRNGVPAYISKTKLSMRIPFFLLLLLLSNQLLAQNSQVAVGAANIAANPSVPANVNASDGVYEKFVLIRWEASDKSDNYRLFRATSAAGASLQELTDSWQKSTWFCDYSAEKGKDYFYAVMGSDGKTSSPLSRFDKGFLKKDDKTAYDESLTSVVPDKYAAGKQIFALVSEVAADTSTYAAGSTARLRIGLQNIFEEATPQTDVRVYISTDAVWDFDDTLLLSKSYSGFPANLKAALEERVLLPKEILPGGHYLLVVAAPEGNILNAKTGSTKINIANQ
jgi:hypothetical protein